MTKSPESDEDVELCDAILDKLSLINIEELSWKDPVASLVLDENSNLIKPLDEISLQQLSFFYSINFSPVPVKFLHDLKWKEVPSKQKQVVDNILLMLKEVWNNYTYSNHKFTKKLNKGSYFSNVINLLLRASLSGIDHDNTYLPYKYLLTINIY
ncbi:hypothetical protein C1646_777054 [Rhizophagus diaphanus]|nr:hypothetical protein C1646_777054 [Rhizophagus diaphanus] [Rhizophagus sp. MUCL 43196]